MPYLSNFNSSPPIQTRSNALLTSAKVILVRLFADDTSIGHTALDEFTLKNMINIDLNNIKRWGDTWLVKFNPNKTEIMIFNIRNQQDELSFDFEGSCFEVL
jgi:hypothetical protein